MIEHACSAAEHVGGRERRAPIEEPLARVVATELCAGPTGHRQPAQLAGEIHRRLAGRSFVELDREHATVVAHDRDVGGRRVHHGVRKIPRDARARFAGQQPFDPCRIAGRPEGVEREHRRHERRRRGMRAELLGEDRHLDRAEPDAAVGFGHLDAEPALLDHRVPQARRRSAAPDAVCARTRGGRGKIVEQLSRAVTERKLVVGEVEVHEQWVADTGTSFRR